MPVDRYNEWKDEFPDFKPNLTPKKVMMMGSFGTTYWRPIYSSVTGKNHKNRHKKFNFFDDVPDDLMTTPWEDYDKDSNKYGVRAGSTLQEWEDKGWINAQDPYGHYEWYCNFYDGRRSSDDRRQVDRWVNTAGPNSRFRKRLINMIIDKNKMWNDESVSPVIRQTLQHWYVKITPGDVERVRRAI